MGQTMLPPFHLAFPVRDVNEARRFYVDVLGCRVGRRDELWVDLDLFGHQIVAHYHPMGDDDSRSNEVHTNPVDRHHVPVPHFGVVLDWDAWQTLSDRLRQAEIDFLIEPHVRFQGQVGEQATMFFLDPSGNALEFKGVSRSRPVIRVLVQIRHDDKSSAAIVNDHGLGSRF